MSSQENIEIPEELLDFEIQLRALEPKNDPELVRFVSMFIPVPNEKVPYPVTSSSFHQFTRFVRKAQYTAGLFGGLVGSLFGAVLGGLCVFLAMTSDGLDGARLPITTKPATTQICSTASDSETKPILSSSSCESRLRER